ncbi:hypothetical protein [Duganella hordei]|uniref:hypothetical protein n=1 Tax=Duganella hordei TaxID=2865934 RepID=UPI0030E8A75E
MPTSVPEEYFLALDRIKQGTPRIVRKDAKINNDSVSLEAGRKKGSIKKSRQQFGALIAAIDDAAAEQSRPQDDQSQRLKKVKETADTLRIELDAALARELSLLAELYDMKKKLAALSGENVLPIRGPG